MSVPTRRGRLIEAIAVLLGVVLCWSLLAPELTRTEHSTLAASAPDPAPMGPAGPYAPGPSEASERGDAEGKDAAVDPPMLPPSLDVLGALEARTTASRRAAFREVSGYEALARERGPPRA